MIARLLGLIPVLVAAVALGKAADDWRLSAVVAAIAGVLTAIGPRWDVDRGRRLLTAAMGAGAGYVVVSLVHDPHRGALGEGWTRIAAAAILAGSARFLLTGAEVRRVTMALVFVALVAIGETHVTGYAAFVALFLLASVWAPVVRDEHLLLTGTAARRLGAGLAVMLFAACTAVVVTVATQRAHAWIAKRQRSFALTWTPRVGFSDRIDLGALDGLLDSDTVVLRVYGGARVDYLRGAVLDSYLRGQWTRSDAAEIETPASYGGLPAEGALKLEAVSGQTDRLFLPLDTRSVVALPPLVVVDALGAIKRSGSGGPLVAHFLAGPRDRAIPAPPGAFDLQLPRAMRRRLRLLAAEWTDGLGTTAEKLDAIERRFKTEFVYAQAFPRVDGPDPAWDFLFDDRRGHCEYFATGMALVARAAGIPARFVAGYRVAEQSPFGYYVVRERNAHSWVEAWVPGQGWTMRDPTPDAELPQNREHRSGLLATLSDGLRVGYADLEDWLQRRTLRQTALAWGLGFAVLLWIVARGVRRRVAPGPALRDDEAALPCLEVLLATLRRQGVAHDGREPIERLAARSHDEDAARLLARYAALRYGGIGDPGALDRDVAAYAKRQPMRDQV